MKFQSVCITTLGLQMWRVLGTMHYDWANIEVGEIDTDTRISDNGQEVFFKQKSNSRTETPLRCVKSDGYVLTFSADKKFVACCLPGQDLIGSKDTAFDCCAAKHILAGSKEVGYQCCPVNHQWDGKLCNPIPPPDPVCNNGKVLVDGKCVCPEGTVANEKDECVLPHKDIPEKCSSGVEAGKCYTITLSNGKRLGYKSDAGYYAAADESLVQQFGKFKFCLEEECKSGGSINPGTGFNMKDIHGTANFGLQSNQWVNNFYNGNHIGKASDYKSAGNFTITKWPCGKYCLSGSEYGLGPTCPNTLPAITFITSDKQSCVPIDLQEVPCDIRAVENNCIWKNGDQCCNLVDCSKTK